MSNTSDDSIYTNGILEDSRSNFHKLENEKANEDRILFDKVFQIVSFLDLTNEELVEYYIHEQS